VLIIVICIVLRTESDALTCDVRGEGLHFEHDLVGLHEQPLHQEQTCLHRADSLVQVRVFRQTQARRGEQILLIIGHVLAALRTQDEA
jgi:hypothetical protein